MKTFSTTDARNKFGEFLDVGMVERIKLVRNNRVIGYFLPERDYVELTNSANAQPKVVSLQPRQLTASQEEALKLYSQGKIGASEAKADLQSDTRGLISLMAQRGLTLPRVSLETAEQMATQALALMHIQIAQHPQEHRIAPHHG